MVTKAYEDDAAAVAAVAALTEDDDVTLKQLSVALPN
jgi:hypothetical protein